MTVSAQPPMVLAMAMAAMDFPAPALGAVVGARLEAMLVAFATSNAW